MIIHKLVDVFFIPILLFSPGAKASENVCLACLALKCFCPHNISMVLILVVVVVVFHAVVVVVVFHAKVPTSTHDYMCGHCCILYIALSIQ